MSSILTNTGAMTALQTLRGINQNLAKTQDMISTGKKVATSKDNAAIWAISKVMDSDVKGFQSISESLNLGKSTVAVARNAAESVGDLLNEIKGRVVSAQEENVDRQKLQNELDALRNQVSSVVNAAQFNGLNLLSNTSTTAGEGSVDVLSSLDRNASGSVTDSSISVTKQDLGQGDNTAGAAATDVGGNAAIAAGASGVAANFTSTTITAGQTFTFDLAGGLDAGADVGTTGTVSYVAREGDTMADVAAQMVARLNYQVTSQGYGDLLEFSVDASDSSIINLQNDSANAITIATADASEDLNGAAADGTIGGALELLGDLDISTENGAAAALGVIESLIQTATDSAAAFGTAEKRIEIQDDFVGKLMDSLKAGIGALVDTDMEEASARLQALQVQQQLGVQALSIANQAPQTILSLFR